MFGALCTLILGMLGVRSFVLISERNRPGALRALDILFALFFLGASALAFLFLGIRFSAHPWGPMLTALVPAALITAALVFRFRTPYRPRPYLFTAKIIGTLLLLVATMGAVMVSGFQFLTEDDPVFRITMTGRSQQEDVQWKSPGGELRSEDLRAYEVHIDTPDATPVARLFVYGDQVAVKARVLRLRPILNAIGIRNLCRVDYIYNGYSTAERHNSYPHRAQEIDTDHPWIHSFQVRFWEYWEQPYFQRTQDPWVKSATLESTFFPLVTPEGEPFRGSYFLTVTPGGLSAIPLP